MVAFCRGVGEEEAVRLCGGHWLTACYWGWGESEGDGALAAGVGDGAGGFEGCVAGCGGGFYEDDAEFACFEHSGEGAFSV